MNNSIYLIAALLTVLFGWELYSGKAIGTWWRANVTREENPWMYWSSMVGLLVMIIAFILTGRSGHARHHRLGVTAEGSTSREK